MDGPTQHIPQLWTRLSKQEPILFSTTHEKRALGGDDTKVSEASPAWMTSLNSFAPAEMMPWDFITKDRKKHLRHAVNDDTAVSVDAPEWFNQKLKKPQPRVTQSVATYRVGSLKRVVLKPLVEVDPFAYDGGYSNPTMLEKPASRPGYIPTHEERMARTGVNNAATTTGQAPFGTNAGTFYMGNTGAGGPAIPLSQYHGTAKSRVGTTTAADFGSGDVDARVYAKKLAPRERFGKTISADIGAAREAPPVDGVLLSADLAISARHADFVSGFAATKQLDLNAMQQQQTDRHIDEEDDDNGGGGGEGYGGISSSSPTKQHSHRNNNNNNNHGNVNISTIMVTQHRRKQRQYQRQLQQQLGGWEGGQTSSPSSSVRPHTSSATSTDGIHAATTTTTTKTFHTTGTYVDEPPFSSYFQQQRATLPDGSVTAKPIPHPQGNGGGGGSSRFGRATGHMLWAAEVNNFANHVNQHMTETVGRVNEGGRGVNVTARLTGRAGTAPSTLSSQLGGNASATTSNNMMMNTTTTIGSASAGRGGGGGGGGGFYGTGHVEHSPNRVVAMRQVPLNWYNAAR